MTRPGSRSASLAVAALLLGAASASGSVALPASAQAATSVEASVSTASPLPASPIDAPAVDTVAPVSAVVNVKTQFGAKGDGVSDDTAALQAAISAGLGFGDPDKIIYLPAGTYLVSRPLEWRRSDGSWSTWLTLLGQNRDRTVIKLKDGAAGFGDPAQPRPVIITGSQNPTSADGSGNQAFHNFIFDLTVDVGAANPGANGIDFLANNRGAIRNVVVRAPQGSGNTGISMARRWPGPCLLQGVRVTGFERGVHLSRWEYGVTIESLRLAGQRVVGIDNGPNVLSVRGLHSQNAVPAVRNGSTSSRYSSLTLVDSQLSGGAIGASAIENEGTVHLRRVATDGYGSAVADRGTPRTLTADEVWSSPAAITRHGSTGAPLGLPVQEAPGLPAVPASDWESVASHGARPDDGQDDSPGIQAALDSGKPVVYLRPGWYLVKSTLRVPPTVQAVVGFDASLDATWGSFAGASTAAVFSATGTTSTPLLFDQLFFKASPGVVDVERLGDRPVALRHVHIGGLPFRGTAGMLFLDDVEGGHGWHFTPGQQVWARQLNAEQPGTKIVNKGGDLWVLGLKTERPGTVIASSGGARTEVLGGLLYPIAANSTPVPAFTATDATQSLSFTVAAYDPTHRYVPLVSSTRGGLTQSVTHEQAPRHGLYGSAVSLYTDVPPSPEPVPPPAEPLRVNAGGGPIDGAPAWSGDTAKAPSAYNNAVEAKSATTSIWKSVRRHSSVPASTPSAVFSSERWDRSSGAPMRWSFPVESGSYDVRLYFAETYDRTQRIGARRFDVHIEGALKLDDYDIYAEVGGYTGVMKTFRVSSDSTLDIDFAHVTENPTISAVEIVPVAD